MTQEPYGSITILGMPEDERPRERLLNHGAEVLSLSELLAIIIGTGTKSKNATVLAGEILAKAGGLKGIADKSVKELSDIKGVGIAKAAKIKALVELSKRFGCIVPGERAVIRSPRDVSDALMQEMRDLDREHFKAILLNTRNQIIKFVTISIGTLNSSMVHPRELFKAAIKENSASIILVHNHPSGDPEPSKADIDITKRLVRSGLLLGIEILDHVIVAGNRYLSFREKGLLESGIVEL
jgi:DNA repair protein RadC